MLRSGYLGALESGNRKCDWPPALHPSSTHHGNYVMKHHASSKRILLGKLTMQAVHHVEVLRGVAPFLGS
eukprot:scaffold5572_cov83-Skeletonema_dohrnii-CCMP3373.AAC.6